MSYSYSYDNARNRYYEACSEMRGCENRIADLKNQRQHKINLINQLKTDIKKNQEALDGVIQIIKSEEDLNGNLLDISNKTSQASLNFIGMVNDSNVTNKNLSDVYGTEMANTKFMFSNIFESLKAKRTALSSKITDLQGQLRRAESDLQDIERQIKSTENDFHHWRQRKSSASYDMEYYRRKRNSAV